MCWCVAAGRSSFLSLQVFLLGTAPLLLCLTKIHDSPGFHCMCRNVAVLVDRLGSPFLPECDLIWLLRSAWHGPRCTSRLSPPALWHMTDSICPTGTWGYTECWVQLENNAIKPMINFRADKQGRKGYIIQPKTSSSWNISPLWPFFTNS